jgi:hypothetical protein
VDEAKAIHACKELAHAMNWRWSALCDLRDDEWTAAMFHMGYTPLVIPMKLVRLAAGNLSGTS